MRKRLPHFLSVGFTFLSLFPFSSYAAFELNPIIAQIAPSGPGATASFTITNADDTRTPVQIGLYRREPDLEGKETYDDKKDVGDAFQIFPSQVILNPKEKRTVRVTYVGNPKITRELAFRIIAEEFPINVTDPKKVKDRAVASISIASRYIGSVYVTPPGSKGELSVEAELVRNPKGNEMALIIENRGTSHVVLQKPKFKVKVGNREYDIPQELASRIGVQNILAGKVRRFVIPWPSEIPAGPVKVTVSVPSA